MVRLDTPSARLRELHETAERISSRLVELEVDPTHKLLESASLSGESADRWSVARTALIELWRRRELLDALIGEADQLQNAKRADELHRLLTGDSVDIANSEVSSADRSLFAATSTSPRCSPDELLEGMSTAFDAVRATMSEIDAAWTRMTSKLDSARQLLGESRELEAEVAESGRSDLESAAQTLARLTTLAATDPLSASDGPVDRVAQELGTIRDDLARTAAVKRGFPELMRAAGELADRLRTAVKQVRDAREEVLVKIVMPGRPADPERHQELLAELTEIAETGRLGAWAPARDALEDWTTRAQAALERTQRTLASLRAPIEARNQFRTLLEAYQAKAKALGLIEDADVAAIYARAQAALYTAPTDLAAAARLLRSYQRAVSGVTPEEDRS